MASRMTDDKHPDSPLYQRDYNEGYAQGFEAARSGDKRKYEYFLTLTTPSAAGGNMEVSPFMQGYFQGYGAWRSTQAS